MLPRGISWNIPPVICIFLAVRTRLKVRVFTEKIQVTREVFHGLPIGYSMVSPWGIPKISPLLTVLAVAVSMHQGNSKYELRKNRQLFLTHIVITKFSELPLRKNAAMRTRNS